VKPERFDAITARYPQLRLTIAGDFCLDRYLEIDPTRQETSIETGLAVHNVARVRSQPGAAGTILNNLLALGVGSIAPVGFCGEDGEGYELKRALGAFAPVRLDGFLQTRDRRTFTYCKPLLMHLGKAPEELNRLDSKNWTPTPLEVSVALGRPLRQLAGESDGLILLDQVDLAETGVVTQALLKTVEGIAQQKPKLWIVGDSRRGLRGFPPMVFKMNRVELGALTGSQPASLEAVQHKARDLAAQTKRLVFVTLAEQGIVGAAPDGTVAHEASLPLRGEIDIVGAGDSVTANLTCALAAGATLAEAITLANAAASLVIHQLGTTGTASVAQIRELLFNR